MFIQNFLVNNLKNDLFYDLLFFSNYENKLPFPLIEFQSEKEFFIGRELIKNIKKDGSDYIESRQSLINCLYLNDKGLLVFHLEDGCTRESCMSGKKKEDPFYDPNNKVHCYFSNKKYIIKFTKDLNVSFKNKIDGKKYSLSLENISIADFKDVFTSTITLKESEIKIKELINKLQNSIIVEDCEIEDICLDIKRNRVYVINGKIFTIDTRIGVFDDLRVGDSIILLNKKYKVSKIEAVENKKTYVNSKYNGMVYLEENDSFNVW